MPMSMASLPVLSATLPPLPPPPAALAASRASMSMSSTSASRTPTTPPTTTPTMTNYRFRDPTQSRPFLCPFPNCDGRFHRKFTLHEHMKTHTGEQPHQCPIKSCGKRFSTSGNLARHKRLHALHKMECPVAGCTRIFTSQEMLAKHQKVHVGSAVHSCALPGCGKTFSTAGNLTRHMKTQHGLSSAQHASSRRHHKHQEQQHYGLSFQRQLSDVKASPANSCSTAGSSPTSSAPGSPNEEVPVVDYDRMLFMPPPAERHFLDELPTASLVHSHHHHARHDHALPQQQQQQQQLPALAQLPQQPHHQFPSNASLSDQDLQHLFECLF